MPRPDSFDEALESFPNHKERLDAFFIANDIEEEKQPSILLSALGARTYSVLKNISAPVLPSTLIYDGMCLQLTAQYSPKALEIMERWRFHVRNQRGG